MHKPSDLHWVALRRLLCYLNGTIDHGVILHRDSPMNLHAYIDADWAGGRDNFASTCYIVYLGHNPFL